MYGALDTRRRRQALLQALLGLQRLPQPGTSVRRQPLVPGPGVIGIQPLPPPTLGRVPFMPRPYPSGGNLVGFEPWIRPNQPGGNPIGIEPWLM